MSSDFGDIFTECMVKGTVQRDFRPLVFFHHSTQPRLLTHGLKYFRILFRFRQDIRILVSKKLTPRSIILRRDSEKYEYLGENENKNENILTHL